MRRMVVSIGHLYKQLRDSLLHQDGERGQVLVLAALFMVIIFGFGALVLDVGYIYLEQSRLQSAVDAGALAGAQSLVPVASSQNSTSGLSPAQQQAEANAQAQAEAMAQKNFQTTQPYSVSFPSNHDVNVSQKITVPLWFARIFGYNNQTIQVSSTGEVSNLSSASGVVPIAITEQEYQYAMSQAPTPVPMTYGAGGGTTGNYGWMDFPTLPNGEHPDLATNIQDGYPGVINVNESIAPYPGNRKSSANRDALTSRVNTNVIVPIVGDIPKGNSGDYVVQGFALFHVTSWGRDQGVGHYTLSGYFVSNVLEPGGGSSGAGSYGVYSTRLIQP